MLVIVQGCVRCHRTYTYGRLLSASEIAALFVCHKIYIFDIFMEDIVCDVCRSHISNDVADEILRIRKEAKK